MVTLIWQRIHQVAIYFNNKLFRGNRSMKVKCEDIDAFDSPNMSPLAVMGTHITGELQCF